MQLRMTISKRFVYIFLFVLSLLLLLVPSAGLANMPSIPALTAKTAGGATTTYSLSVKILIAMTVLTVLPALLMTLTSFTRIIIVLAMLRQAVGMPTVPTNQILLGLSLFLTLFIMTPVFQKMNTVAVQPYLSGKIDEMTAVKKGQLPLRQFMIKQTRKADLALFMKISHHKPVKSYDNIPFIVLMPAYLTSELKSAFQIGLMLYLPFLIIDIVVASILMSMGMMMLSPLIVSLPFKVMLFVLADGWTLVLGTLANSFH